MACTCVGSRSGTGVSVDHDAMWRDAGLVLLGAGIVVAAQVVHAAWGTWSFVRRLLDPGTRRMVTTRIMMVALIAAGIVIMALTVGALWYRADAAEARATLAEFRRAYDLLAQSVQRQNAAIQEAEGKAAEAARRGAQARAEAVPVVEAARRSADALAGELRGLRPPECPTAKAVEVVRGDLQR